MDIGTLCHRCNSPVTLSSKIRIDTWRRSGRTFCSDQCKRQTLSAESSARMASTNRRHASKRMKARNPMRLATARRKMIESLRRIRHRPAVRGGNGKPLPLPQAALALALGWETEVVVPTRSKRGGVLPTHYKIDIASPTLKIAIEVDGQSHYGVRRAADQRKDSFLRSRGWTVLRFANREVTADLAACVRTVLSTT